MPTSKERVVARQIEVAIAARELPEWPVDEAGLDYEYVHFVKRDDGTMVWEPIKEHISIVSREDFAEAQALERGAVGGV